MKYLILFLIPINLLAATFQIEVKNYKTNTVSHGQTLEGSEAQAWVNKIASRQSPWGYKKQRFIADLIDSPISPEDLNDHANVQCWDRVGVAINYRDCVTNEVIIQEFVAAYQTPELDIDGNETGEIIDVEEVPEVKATSYEVPATYKLVITDITQQVADEQAEKDANELERTQLRNAISVFRNGNASNKQVQRAIAYILKRM